MLDLSNNISVVQSIPAKVIATDTTTLGTAASLANANSAVVIFDIGTVTDGTYTPKVQETFNGTDWTDVAAADLDGTLTAVTTANDPSSQKVGYKGTAGQIRAAITSATTTSGGPMGAIIVLGNLGQIGGSPIIE